MADDADVTNWIMSHTGRGNKTKKKIVEGPKQKKTKSQKI